MADFTKTTVYLHATDYGRLKALARQHERPAAELIREAVSEYVQRHGDVARPKSVGAGRSGAGDLSERAEELLRDFGGSA
jgi:predicted transcriptional regulator